MRPTAEVEPIALAVDRHGFAVRQSFDQFHLEVLAKALEISHGVGARPFLPHQRLIAADDLLHLGFDLFQIVRGEGLIASEVVIETGGDRRADGDLRAGIEFLHRFGQHMGAVVADDLQRVGVAARDDLNLRVGGDSGAQILQNAVDLNGEGVFGETRADGGRDLSA